MGGCIRFGPFIEPGESEISGDGGALPAHWVPPFAIVEVSLDGSAPRPFLLDTGASVLVIAPDVAAELSRSRDGAAAESREVAITGSDGAVGTAQDVVRIAELRCGPLTVRGIDALVVDLDLPRAALGAPIDGILPGVVAGDALLTIDWPARTA